jgi:hypothetical protein
MLYLTGFTGSVNQYAPFDFAHCVNILFATFYQF